MQQLFAAFGIDWRLLIAQTVNFGIVLIALWYFLYRPVMTMIEKRRALVAEGVEDARRAKEKLAGADTEAAMRVSGGEREAEAIVGRARQEAGKERAVLLAEAHTRAESIEREAHARAQEDAAKVLRESDREIARLAVLAAKKVMQDNHA